MNRATSWQSTVIGVALIGLVGLMFWRASADVEHFTSIWAAVGAIVGVVTGALPGYFFGRAGQQAARDADLRAEYWAAHVPAEKAAAVTSELTRDGLTLTR